ncbi:hypothetical protein [Mucilaginibacter agri]|uniref:Uncharacterized protein n=1 Tax=Mucilaginibacter agri TaxID=2695265 RepID=A0A965ZLP7_9SPHI|nr:hypothetical protein [Mucilaginibacter agri]NCD72239.1 hypothetical protein [Mucilaginibacter agri]
MKKEKFVFDRKLKIILVSLVLLIVVCVAPFLIWSEDATVHRGQLVLQDAALQEFHGRVDSVYLDKNKANARTLLLSDGNTFMLYPDWQSKVNKGDSLSKEKNVYQVNIYRDGKAGGVLDYKELVKAWEK